MNQKTTSFVISQLESYPQLCTRIEILKFEIQNEVGITPEEMIEVLSFHRKVNGESDVSYHTIPDIAMNYRMLAEKLNAERIEEISLQYLDAMKQCARIQRYVSLLKEKQRKVIELHYFDGLAWSEVAEKMGIAARTVLKIRQRAVEKLEELYLYTDKLFNFQI